jgi:metacaspase-1
MALSVAGRGGGGAATATAATMTTSVPTGPPPAATAAPGRKRALLIGCNYPGQASQLGGCVNDAQCLAHLLTTRFGFAPENVTILADTSPHPAAWPTRAAILHHISLLVSDARAGDSLFFSFSGHGTQVEDWSGDEAQSQAILPCDHAVEGFIVDDELNALLVNPLPPGAHLHAVIDACHSGSMLDLEWRAKAREGGVAFFKQEYTHAPSVWKGTAGGFVAAFSASRDKQTAADTSALSGDGSHTGAATYALIAAIEAAGPAITYGALLASMKATLDAVSGGPGPAVGDGVVGRLLQGLLDAAGASGQTPSITSNVAFDLNTPLCI